MLGLRTISCDECCTEIKSGDEHSRWYERPDGHVWFCGKCATKPGVLTRDELETENAELRAKVAELEGR